MPGAVTKRDLVKTIAENTGLKQGDIQKVVQVLLDSIIAEIAGGKRIELRDFGVFEARRKKARIARNPRTGESVHVGERLVPHFKAGRLMKLSLNGK
ncbi:MAG: integration host factor subunit beta [Planctomycetes bacterium]|nr:integration host factor subunit beta [Planctomycetota bacterium]